MSINQLRKDVEEHFQRFERAPFKEAWRRRDARICLIWMAALILAFSGALIFLPAPTLTDYVPALLPVLLTSLIIWERCTRGSEQSGWAPLQLLRPPKG